MKYLRLAYEEEQKLNALSRSEWDTLKRRLGKMPEAALPTNVASPGMTRSGDFSKTASKIGIR